MSVARLLVASLILCTVLVALVRPLWLLVVLIALSPFHSYFRSLFPDAITIIVWRDVVSWLIVAGVAARLAIRRERVLSHPLNALVLAYIGWGLFQIINTGDLVTGIYGFGTVIRYAPLFFATLALVQSERDVEVLLKPMILAGSVIAIFAIVELLFPDSSIFALVTREQGSRPILGFRTERLSSIFGQGPNGLAIYLAFIACLLVPQGFGPKGSGVPGRLYRWLFWLYVIVIALTTSRLAWLGLGAALFLFVVLSHRSAGSKRMIPAWIAVSAVALGVYAIFLPGQAGQSFIQMIPSLLAMRGWLLPTNVVSTLIGTGYYFDGTKEFLPLALQPRTLASGAVDILYLHSIYIIGLVGLLLELAILGKFLCTAVHGYVTHAQAELAWLPLALAMAFVVMAVATFHSTPWDYAGLDVNYYVLGAIAVWYQLGLRQSRR